MKSHIDYYAYMASRVGELTQLSGRYLIQQQAEKLIVPDVISKLRTHPECTLLEIGCGPGNLLIPISFGVKCCVGVDHPDVIERFRKRYEDPKIELIGGNFLELDIQVSFDRILIYSVLPTMKDEEMLLCFVNKALALLKPNGRMLLGDLNNTDRKRRFVESERGRKFQQEWEAMVADSKDEPVEKPTEVSITINDSLIARLLLHLREQGWHAYLQEQPEHLPFGNTREDIVVVGSEYSGA